MVREICIEQFRCWNRRNVAKIGTYSANLFSTESFLDNFLQKKEKTDENVCLALSIVYDTQNLNGMEVHYL